MIYTKRGDQGKSRLKASQYLAKDGPLFKALGTIDELNSWLGLIRSFNPEDKRLDRTLKSRQTELFLISQELAGYKKGKKLSLAKVRKLEKEIDSWQKELKKINHFIFPGGKKLGSLIQVSRAVCRRTEQEVVTLNKEEKINKNILAYFNRLSDWLFILARKINQEQDYQEEVWQDA